MPCQSLHIWKFESTGNDFILVDDRSGEFRMSPEEIGHLCHRRFGAGADGLILLGAHPSLDFAMRYFNSDGLEATFCGNGGRAVCGFASLMGIDLPEFTFEAADGIHTASIRTTGARSWDVELGMREVVVSHNDFIDTGSPHHLLYVDEVGSVDVRTEGAAIRNSATYSPGGCNVNFIGRMDGKLFVRTYERGVEDETLSCGTGVTAAAIFHSLDEADGHHAVKIRTKGGSLEVRFDKQGKRFIGITLAGGTRCVFEGNYYYGDHD